MSKLMWIAGILLAAAGVALGLMVLVSPASVAAVGVTLDTAVTLLVGGILSLGLGSVITGLGAQRHALGEGASPVRAAAPPPAPIPEFGRKASEAAPAAAAAAAITAATVAKAEAEAQIEEEVSEPTRETIEALEDARQKIEQAFEAKPAEPEVIEAAAPPEPEPEPAPRVESEAVIVEDEAATIVEEAQPEEDLGEGQLYVVEERYIRMRPARILSDGTVEAETAEGWMRFENLEHLDEYLDAMEPAKS